MWKAKANVREAKVIAVNSTKPVNTSSKLKVHTFAATKGMDGKERFSGRKKMA